VYNVQGNDHVGTTLSDEFAMVYLPEEEAGSLKQWLHVNDPVNDPSMKWGSMI
jgi:hypothetical protein